MFKQGKKALVGVAALALGGAAIANAATSQGTSTSPSSSSSQQAAAVKAVGGGTAGAVTADYTQKGYEVTVTKPDGSKVEVHLPAGRGLGRPPAPYGG